MTSLIKQLSFRTQLLVISLILVIIPASVLSFFFAGRNVSQVTEEYSTSSSAVLTQAEQAVDTLLRDALKIADTPLLSDDIRRAMTTDYRDQYINYAADSNRFRTVLRLANRINGSMRSIVFQNHYGYAFEYNVTTVEQSHRIEQNIADWTSIARQRSSHLYLAPLLTDAVDGRTVLPVLKLVLDGQTFHEIGVCYGEIDFTPLSEILTPSKAADNPLFILDEEEHLIWTSDSSFDPLKDQELNSALADFAGSLEPDVLSLNNELEAGCTVNGCINRFTGWRLVQVVNDRSLRSITSAIYASHLRMLLLCLLFGVALAILFSSMATRPLSRLCSRMDQVDPEGDSRINEAALGTNRELLTLIASFNNLNARLTDSLHHNYEILLREQQMRLQMLRFQINHHFLHNTLNVIKALADIHQVPEIGTIAVSMSELLRYSLEKGPTALLEEELQQVRRYMAIQNIRFPGKFHCDINIPSELLSFGLPVFLLQPLVENSIEHGFSGMTEHCYISISCQLEADCLHLLVADNGSGIPEERLKELRSSFTKADDATEESVEGRHRSIGLRNIALRLRNHYGPAYGIELESVVGEGTIADLSLPLCAPTADGRPSLQEQPAAAAYRE